MITIGQGSIAFGSIKDFLCREIINIVKIGNIHNQNRNVFI